MMKQIFYLLAGLGMSASVLASCSRNPPPAQIYLVRHAEKQTGTDPSLTPAGAARAQALSNLLSSKNIEAIYSTDYARTQETAAPLAKRLGLNVISYDPSDLRKLATYLQVEGQNALVVGHSNTTPALVTALGGVAGAPIDDATEFDRIYQVSLHITKPPKTRQYTYP